MITDPRSSLTETKSSRKESSFPAEMPLTKLTGVANRQSPVIAPQFLPLCHRNTSLGCVLTNALGRENLLKCQSCVIMSLLLLIYLRDGPNMCSHCTKLWHKTYPICNAPPSRSARCSFAHRNRTEMTFRMCEQKHYPVGFSWRRKSIPPYGVNTAIEYTPKSA